MRELDRVRASDQERDAVAVRLQVAFAEGRIDDIEFDQRMRAALTARTRADLAELTADLPEAPRPLPATPARRPGRFAVAFKSTIAKSGRWQVPGSFTTVVYKGEGEIDLRAAELTAHVTTIVAVAYKSRIGVVVPPGVRVETGGLGVSTAVSGEAGKLPTSAPIVHVRGYAYKGSVEVVSSTPGQH